MQMYWIGQINDITRRESVDVLKRPGLGGGGGGRERERDTHTHTHTQKETERHKQTDRQTECSK